jgi:O-antigen/teichoic acid export membrane protein
MINSSLFKLSVSKLYTSIFNYINQPIARNIVLVFVAGMVASAMGLVGNVLISRNLGPEAFGVYSMAILFIGMASELADMGINLGIVRFASPFIASKNENDANQIFYVSLIWKIVSAIFFFLLLFLTARPMAEIIFQKPQLYQPFQLASFGIFGALLPGFIGSVLQSYNFFGKKVSIDLFIGLAKLMAVLIFIGLSLLTAKSGVLIFGIVPMLGFALGLVIAPKGYLKGYKWDQKVASRIFSFSKWITVATVCTIFLSRMELLILGRISDTYSTGLFAAAIQITLIVRVLLGAMTTVLFPRVSAMQSTDQMRKYVKISILASLSLIVCFIPLILWAKPLINLIFGAAYLPAAPYFSVILIGNLFSIFINPLSLLMYSLNKPFFLALVNIIQLPVSLFSNLLLINRYGAMGAAYTSVIIRVLATIIIGAGIYFYLYSKNAISLDC